MSRLRWGWGLPLLLLWCGLAAAADGDAVEMRYKMTKGEPQYYRTETSLKSSQSVAGATVETELQNSELASRSLESVDDQGRFRVRTTNIKTVANMKIGPLGEYKYDSSSTERDEGSALGAALNPVYEKMNGATISFTLSPRGEVSAVDGLQQLLEDVLKNNPLGQQIIGGGTDKAAEVGLSELYVAFSERPVKPGDTWEAKYQIDLPQIGKTEGKRIYTYEGPDKVGDRQTARIRVNHELSVDIDLNQNGAKVKGTMKVDQSSGIVHFDPARGQIVSMESTYKLSGELTVDAGGKLIPVKTEQNQEIKVSLLDKPPEQKAAKP